jgi:polyhydroxybutyrate depolymerase
MDMMPMRVKIFVLLVLLFFTSACSSQHASLSQTVPQRLKATATTASPTASVIQKDYTESMQSGGLTRTYYIHLPVSYQKGQPLPLVLAFHGSSATGKDLARQSHLNDIADSSNFIVVYPDGYQQQWADGRGTTPPEQDGVDDVSFVSDLIDKLTEELAVDSQRVYAVGMSNGGIFSHRLACERADKITAIASVSGTMAQNISEDCQPSRPVPVLLFMGTDDPSVPFEGGEVDGDQGVNLSTADTIQQWVDHDTCTTAPVTTDAPPATNDGTEVLRTIYSSCKENTDVVLYTIEGGVHAWPGSGEPVQPVSAQTHLDASQVIWEFFQHYHH